MIDKAAYDYLIKSLIVVIFGLFATLFHEFLHFSSAIMMGCDAEIFFDHVVKSECSILNIKCQSIGLDTNYCLSDFLITISAPAVGILLSLLGTFALKYFKHCCDLYQFLCLLLSFFFLRSSLNLLITDLLTSLGMASSLRLSDEDRIQLYMNWNPAVFRFAVHGFSLAILVTGFYLIGWRKWRLMMVPILIGGMLLLVAIAYI